MLAERKKSMNSSFLKPNTEDLNRLLGILNSQSGSENTATYSLSMNSSAFGGSGGRPFLFLISVTSPQSMFCGTGCHVLK